MIYLQNKKLNVGQIITKDNKQKKWAVQPSDLPGAQDRWRWQPNRESKRVKGPPHDLTGKGYATHKISHSVFWAFNVAEVSSGEAGTERKLLGYG